MLQQIGVTRADISFLHAATDRNSNLRLQAATGSVINITLTRGALNGGLSRRLPLHLVPVDHQPSKLVMVMPQHQMMPAVNPEPERLDETQVKTIQAKVNNKLDPAMPVRTRTPSRAVPCGPRAQHEPCR